MAGGTEPAALVASPTRRGFLLGIAGAGCSRRRGAGFPGYALVANRAGSTVAAVDLTKFSLAGQIPIPARPTAVLATAEQPLGWVLAAEAGKVFEIETARLAVRRTVQAARSAISMRFGPRRQELWVLCREPRQLVRLRLNGLQEESHVPLPADPADFDLSPDGRWAAVSLADGGGVLLADLVTGRLHGRVPQRGGFTMIRFRSDGRQLLAGDREGQMLCVLDVPSGRTIVRLPLAVRPEHFCFKPDGGQLFVTGEGLDGVVVVYPYRTEVAETVLAGKAPAYMAASSAPDYLFVANPPSGDVTILDVETRQVIAIVAVGGRPGYITVTPDNQYALVLNEASGSMAVIRIAAIVSRRTKAAPLFTMIPVGSGPVNAAVCRA